MPPFSFSAPALFAQQPSPTPPLDDGAVVKISTNLIQVDVTVTDKNGKVVTGLAPDDFEIFENGEKQKISGFSFQARSIASATAGDASQPKESMQAAVAGAPLARGDVRRTIAVVVDDLNLSFPSIYFTRRALRKFVDEQMQPGDLVAIIRTGGGIGAMQQFTSDKRLLNAAIEKIRWNPLGDGGFDTLTSVGQTPEDVSERFRTESDAIANKAAGPTDIPRKGFNMRENVSDKKMTDYNVSHNAGGQEAGIFAQTSLGAISYIINGMNSLPGRKAMMLFSDGIEIGNDSNKSRGSSVYQYLQDVVDTANRSSVVVYTFDTKGMRSMSIAASDSTYEIIDGHRGQKEKARLKDFKDSQDGLVFSRTKRAARPCLTAMTSTAGSSGRWTSSPDIIWSHTSPMRKALIRTNGNTTSLR